MQGKLFEQLTVPDSSRIIRVDAAAAGTTRALKVFEQTVVCYATAGNLTITLPNVLEAFGLFYSIYCKDLTSPSTVTVQDNNESLGWSDMSLTADSDRALLYSDGVQWNKIIDVTT